MPKRSSKKPPKSKSRHTGASAPLEGITVLDLTRILSGPYCAMKLGDMGAEVIKIEVPRTGDETRKWGPPFVKGESAYFLSVNRNKKSLTLNLKSSEGKEILRALIKKSDVLVENFRAGVMESLGFGPDAVHRLNPRLVFCSISGYGQTSSISRQPSYDLIVQGESGLMDLTGEPGAGPTKAGISLADVMAGTLAFEGILLALLRRGSTGKGSVVDISLLDALASLFTYQSQIALSGTQKARRMGNRHPTITPYETFATLDGFINVAAGNENHWKSFCEVIGMPDLTADPRFASNAFRVRNRSGLEAVVIPVLKTKPTSFWLRRFIAHDVPAGKINSLEEMLGLGVIRERSMIVETVHPAIGKLRMVGNPIRLSGMPETRPAPPPRLGEHTNAILKSLGYSATDVSSLRARNIV